MKKSKQCVVCLYSPREFDKDLNLQKDRKCDGWWLCSFDCHRRFHVTFPDNQIMECEDERMLNDG